MGNFLSGLFSPKTDFKALIDKGAVIVDVRTREEFSSGHIDGSVNYPLDSLASKMEELKKHRNPVIVVCRSGARSAAAVTQLKAAGIEAYNGGGWTVLEKLIG